MDTSPLHETDERTPVGESPLYTFKVAVILLVVWILDLVCRAMLGNENAEHIRSQA